MSLLLSKDLLWSFKWGSRAVNAQHQKEVGYRNSTRVNNPALVQWSSVDAGSGWVSIPLDALMVPPEVGCSGGARWALTRPSFATL